MQDLDVWLLWGVNIDALDRWDLDRVCTQRVGGHRFFPVSHVGEWRYMLENARLLYTL